ncbi:MAG: HU family DNA-binding protein [Prevotellaceae bacterium]|jgi:cell division protein FtsN|nr:HU family DNA-binding protein [Prevotellaceae bacterium]
MIQNLKALVLGNRRLIIPAVGAFLVKEEDSQVRIIFSSFLKYDDGLLTKLLSNRDNISEEQAKSTVETFAREILNTLNNGNNFSIPDFGYFAKDNRGTINFIVEKTDSSALPEANAADVKQEEPVFTTYVPPVTDTPVGETQVAESAVEETPVNETFVFGNTEQESQNDFNNDFNFTNYYTPPATDNTSTERTTVKKKTSHAGYWILTIILIIIAAALLLYFLSKDIKQKVNSLFVDKPKIEIKKDTTAIVVDTLNKNKPEDTVAVKHEEATHTTHNTQHTTQTTHNAPHTAQTTPTSIQNGKYQVIAGCYLERAIAEHFADELRRKGYNARIPDGRAGEWTLVIVYESNDMNDAIRLKDSFVADGYADAWVRTKIGYSSTATNKITTDKSASYSHTTSTNASNTKSRGRYQTIAGCYLFRENAEKYANEMRSKGFDVTIPDRLMGEWTILILCESDDLNEVNKVKEKSIAAGYDAWIRTR